MRLSYSATEHPENYAEKLYNTPGAGEYATNYTYDFNDRLTKAIFGTDSYRVTYWLSSLLEADYEKASCLCSVNNTDIHLFCLGFYIISV